MTLSRATWVIGDIQGCLASLNYLLNQPGLLDDPNAEFCFAGDLINRGPHSLAVLQRIHNLGSRAYCVLGNHDIHFLSVAAGMRQPNRFDTFQDILNSQNSNYWINWLRQQPLYLKRQGHLIVHAGIHPNWSLNQLKNIAHEIQQRLRDDDWAFHLSKLFGNEPAQWSTKLTGYDRQRFGINVLTRIRYIKTDGRLDFSFKQHPQQAPKNLTPWFQITPRKITLPIVFGHWSTLGLTKCNQAIGLDTGALWGGQLTALRLEDGKIVQVPAQEKRPLQPIE